MSRIGMTAVDIETGMTANGTYGFVVWSLPSYHSIHKEDGFSSWEQADQAASDWCNREYGKGHWFC